MEPGKGQGTRPRAAEQSVKLMRTRPELAIDLVAAEPLVTSPVAVDFGPDGKIWLAEMFDYPAGTDGTYGPGGRVRVLTSSNGKIVDTSTIFLDGIPFPTGITVWRKGVLICAAPDILYAKTAMVMGGLTSSRNCIRALVPTTFKRGSIAWNMDWMVGCTVHVVSLVVRSHRLQRRTF